MLAGSLQLEEPWYVEGAEFDSEKSEIHIHVGIRPRLAFRVHVAAQQPSDTATSQKRGCGGMLTASSIPAMSIAAGPRCCAISAASCR